MNNKTMGRSILFFSLLICLSGCGRTKEEPLFLLEGAETAEQSDSSETEELQESSQEASASGQLSGKAMPTLTETLPDSAESDVVTIHVCGAVIVPGVYELDAPARIVDAIAAAGGTDETAADHYLNQAAFLTDGQQVYVPTEEEAEQAYQLPANAGADTIGTQAAVQESVGVNINTASKEELMNLSGIGEAKAESIIRYREASGGFRTIEDIMQVEGIKEGLFRKMQEQICIGP